MAKRLGTIHDTSKAVDTDLFSSPFTYTANTNPNLNQMKKLIIQISPATGAANLRAIIVNTAASDTIVLGVMTTALYKYTYELLWKAGDAVDFQYNGIAGPMKVNMIVLESDDININYHPIS